MVKGNILAHRLIICAYVIQLMVLLHLWFVGSTYVIHMLLRSWSFTLSVIIYSICSIFQVDSRFFDMIKIPVTICLSRRPSLNHMQPRMHDLPLFNRQLLAIKSHSPWTCWSSSILRLFIKLTGNVRSVKVEECKSHVLIRTLSYFSKWKT